MARPRRTYTAELKAQAVKLVTEQGHSVAEAAPPRHPRDAAALLEAGPPRQGRPGLPRPRQPRPPRRGAAPPPRREQAPPGRARQAFPGRGNLRAVLARMPAARMSR